MNTKLVELLQHFPDILRFAGITVWGVVTFLLLLPLSASAREPTPHDQNALLVMRPSDLPVEVQTSGEDMYLYEGSQQAYLYIEQNNGRSLLILDVSDPQRILKVSEAELTVDVPYDFVGPLGGDSVLVHFHTKDGEPSEWGRLRLNQPRSPLLVTWIQSSRDIVDPSISRVVNDKKLLPSKEQSTNSYWIVDSSDNQPHLLATIPGVKKTLIDSEEALTFYLASDGVWILRNLSSEKQHQAETDQLN